MKTSAECKKELLEKFSSQLKHLWLTPGNTETFVVLVGSNLDITISGYKMKEAALVKMLLTELRVTIVIEEKFGIKISICLWSFCCKHSRFKPEFTCAYGGRML